MKEKASDSLRYEDIHSLYKTPLMPLIFQACSFHQKYHPIDQIETCSLLSIKTGACQEDCAYCAQSSRYKTDIKAHKLLDEKTILEGAKNALIQKATHFCLSSSGKEVKTDKDFALLLTMIEEISSMGLKVCATMGSVTLDQAKLLKKAGVYAYNHNIDTSPRYYKEIITTRSFNERIETLKIVKKAGIKVCSGGIIGMKETEKDRIDWIYELKKVEEFIDFVPINVLIPIPNTPLEHVDDPSIWDLLRVIATLRISLPEVKIRFAAGRNKFSHEEQLLCLLAGVNSFHIGQKLLTAKNCPVKEDEKLLQSLLSHHAMQ